MQQKLPFHDEFTGLLLLSSTLLLLTADAVGQSENKDESSAWNGQIPFVMAQMRKL
jgi:hypothetical protein